jgi:hypothetical protein
VRVVEDPKVWAALLGTLVGGVLGFALGEIKEWLARRRRRKAHWLALSAEAEICRELAEEFLRANVMAPLYRLPTLSYSHSFPVLLADGAPSDAEARAVTQFFNEVETLNRGIDQANEARNDDAMIRDEFARNRLKAESLVGSVSYEASHRLGSSRWEDVALIQALNKRFKEDRQIRYASLPPT